MQQFAADSIIIVFRHVFNFSKKSFRSAAEQRKQRETYSYVLQYCNKEHVNEDAERAILKKLGTNKFYGKLVTHVTTDQ